MQKHVSLFDLVKCFPTHILLQKLASIQKRTSPVKFAHLAEKSGKCSISNLSTKAETLSHEFVRVQQHMARFATFSGLANPPHETVYANASRPPGQESASARWAKHKKHKYT